MDAKKACFAKNSRSSVFVYILSGVFEVQNRLLHMRDGLSLRNLEEVEFEALAQDSVILLAEV